LHLPYVVSIELWQYKVDNIKPTYKIQIKPYQARVSGDIYGIDPACVGVDRSPKPARAQVVHGKLTIPEGSYQDASPYCQAADTVPGFTTISLYKHYQGTGSMTIMIV